MASPGLEDPVEVALAVNTAQKLADYLIDLAGQVRAGRAPAENSTASDLIEASGYWTEGIERFLSARGINIAEASPWAIAAMIFSAGLVYE